MSSLVRSELRKLTSTAATWWLALGVVALSLLAGATGSSNADAGEPLSHQQFVFVAAFTTKLVFVLLGIRIMTDELRHGTVIPTFLVSPRRGRVLMAKALFAAGSGVVLGALGQGVLYATASITWRFRDASLHLGGDAVLAAGGAVLVAGAWCVLGVAIGALLRSPVVAVSSTLVWLLGVEDVVRGRIGDAGDHLPGNAGTALALGLGGSESAAAAAAVAGYVLVAMGAALVVLRRRDV